MKQNINNFFYCTIIFLNSLFVRKSELAALTFLGVSSFWKGRSKKYGFFLFSINGKLISVAEVSFASVILDSVT